MAYYWYKGGVAANYNSNNNIQAPLNRANLLPSKTVPKGATQQISGSGRSRQSVNPWDMSTMRSDIQSSSPQVPRKYSSDRSYHTGSHNVQPSGQSRKTTNSIDPPPYQPPDYESLGRGAHSGPSIPRQRRKERRSSRSTDKLDSKASSRSRSLSRDRNPSSSTRKSTQESDRQSHDRVRSTHSFTYGTVTGAGKVTRSRSRSQSRDRLSMTATSHTSSGGDILSRDRNPSSKPTQESDRQSHDRVRSTETVTEAGKVARPRSRSQSRDRLSTTATSHTSDGGDILSRDRNSSSSACISMQESDRQLRGRVRRTHSPETVTVAGKVNENPYSRSRSQSRDRWSTSHISLGGDMQDRTISNSKLGLAGHTDATMNSVSNDRTQNEEDARYTGSEVKGGKEKKTTKVRVNTPTRLQPNQSTPIQGEVISTSQLGSAGHQNTPTTVSSVHPNKLQNEGEARSSGSSHSPSSPSTRASPGYSSLFPMSGGTVGISNLGNTCFMNSMLQCLGQTGEMTEIFLKNPGREGLVKAYSELMQKMWKKSRHSSLTYHALYPRDLKDIFSRLNPQFSGYNQHDSQEFMRFLVSGLHEELRSQPPKKPEPPKDENDSGQWWKWYMTLEDSPLAKVFVGQLRSTLTCQKCHHESLTFDPFWELSVSMQKKAASPSSTSMASTSYSAHCSPSYSSFSTRTIVHLEESLDLFTRKETLAGDEKPFCTKCRSLQRCSKKMTIERLPKVLVIHLKRFSGYGYRSKLSTPVTIPHILDLTKYCTDENNGHTYELYALSHHTGSVYFGHYTAWCKHYSTGKWHSYNDSSVTRNTSSELTSHSEFPSSTAYVLFYRQTDSSHKPKITSV